ncbi:hypothetical protein Bca4012_056313 [Brassica carinata]
MAANFNERSGVKGNIPLGYFNSMFNYTGSWQVDASSTKSLALVGYVIPLYEVKLANLTLVLRNEIKQAVPSSWDPASLARYTPLCFLLLMVSVVLTSWKLNVYVTLPTCLLSFIENYGTHIVTSVTVGGRDMVYIRQHQTSPLPVSEIENYVNDMEEQRFHKAETQSITGSLKYKDKPPVEDLQYFLDFQIARAWAPEQSNLQRKEPVCKSLHFSLMGPKLFISADQVTVGRKPVTGLRLSLEGSKQNRLSIHLQHLVSLPKILQPHWDPHVPIGAPKWQGPEEQDSRWFEPIKWKKFSHVSTSPIEHTETHIGDLSGVHIVTGAQLGVWNFGSKSVLHLKLLFSKVPGCTIRRSVWDHTPVASTARLEPGGPSTSNSTEEKREDVSGQLGKLAKIVDSSEMLKGPQDLPGHWLVTGAKLGVEKGIESIISNRLYEKRSLDEQKLCTLMLTRLSPVRGLIHDCLRS